MKMRRAAQATSNAIKRRKVKDVNISFAAPMLPAARDYGEHGQDLRQVLARENLTAPVDQARMELLRTIERLAPRVLSDLARVELLDGDVDDEAIGAWARRYGIDAPWMRIAAKNTLQLWKHWPKGRGRRFELNLIDSGCLVPRPGRLPRRPPELLIRRVHFEWLVRHHCLDESWRRIQLHSPETPRKAAAALAATLGIAKPAKHQQTPR